MQTDQKTAAEIVREMAGGFTLTQVLYTAVKLGIADHLKNGPLPSHELARAVYADRQSLHRFLRMMVVVNLLVQHGDGGFALSALGELLRTDHPDSLCNRILYIGEVNYPAAQGMSHAVQTGEPGFDHIFSMPFFEYFSRNPHIGALFNELMSQGVEDRVAGIVLAYDFSKARSIVDVGGGKGTLISAILKANSQATGILFDAPSVLAEAENYLAANGLAERCQTVSGDFFQDDLPPDADIYILSNILHDWEDASVAQILNNCSGVMLPDSRLLVIEQLMPKHVLDAPVTVASDLSMMLLLRGRERTEAEYREILSQAGLQVTSLIPFAATRIYNGRKTNWVIIESKLL